jgi:hypothetical protein
MESAMAGIPRDRRFTLERSGARDGGEEILEIARQVRAEAVIPTGDDDMRATSHLGWVFDLRGVALAAPAPWTIEACRDPTALERIWTSTGEPPRGVPGAETWWDVIADREGALRWIHTRGAGTGREGMVRVAKAVRSLGLRYASSLRMRIGEDGQGRLVEVVPRFNGALAPVLARGINLPRILLEVLVERDIPRAPGGAPSTSAADGSAPQLTA